MATLRATYSLYVDWNDDGDFGDAGEDISADWMHIAISRGYSSPLARYPSVGRMTVTLRNAAKTYSPPATAAARPQHEVKLDMTYDGDTVTLFRGWIESLRPESGTRRNRRAVMECVDALSLLDLYEGDIELQTNVHANDIIDDVVSAVYTPPSDSYDAGVNLFPTAADRWTGQLRIGGAFAGGVVQTVSASGKIQDACVSDWGRFFISKAGVPTYYNRHRMPFDTTTALTLDDTMVALDYEMSATSAYNHIEVTCYPRTIGTDFEVLGRLDQAEAPGIEAGESVTYEIAFRDPANTAITLGGLSTITPIATTDYTCTSDEAGEGDDLTSDVTVSGCDKYGDRVSVTLENGGAVIAYIQTLEVRGLAVRAMESITVTATNDEEPVRRLRLDAPLMSSQVDAQNLADYLLSYYADPLHDIKGVGIIANSSATLMEAVRDLELCDRVVLTESQTGLDEQVGFIYAMHHSIEQGGIHRLSFDLEQAYDYGADPGTWDSSVWDGADVWVY